MRRSNNRTDANQAEIVDALRKVGCGWLGLSGDPSLGCDGLVVWRGKILVCEIKDDKKPPSQRKLTPTEAKRKLWCEVHRIPYVILLNPDQALEAIGAI